MLLKTYLPIAALGLLLLSCARKPLSGRGQPVLLPHEQMLHLSNEAYQQVLRAYPRSDSAQHTQLVEEVGQKLTAAVREYMRRQNLHDRIEGNQWTYTLLASDQANAFCLPGGQIAFFEGIMPLCRDADGVAAVMAHEIAHAIARHGNERLVRQLTDQFGGMTLEEALVNKPEQTQQAVFASFGLGAQVGQLLPFSAAHELEADEVALYFMALAGYDPRQAPALWERMALSAAPRPPELLATHPSPENRAKNFREHMRKAVRFYRQNNREVVG